jgi:transcriptional regulator with XRE-family HTH domain
MGCDMLHVMQPTRIHASKTPKRFHFIVEWAEKRDLKQADIIREIGADKSVVSRWFSGSVPSEKYLEPLAALFHTDVAGLFRHPDDDWISRFLASRTSEERERAITLLSTAFPPKTGTDD